jgi:hypothetical protein
MAYRVVCISLTTAAGGEPIGHAVAERLGFRYVDAEVITLAAQTADIDPAVVEQAEDQRGLFARLTDALVASPRAPEGFLARERSDRYYAENVAPPVTPPKDELRRLIQGAILEIGRRGLAVIVAHAASFALARQPDVLRVHVTASTAVRLKRLWVPNKLVSEEDYAQAITDSDRARQRYLSRFYDVHEESPTDYDLVINTDRLGMEQAVAAIVAAATA